MRVDPEIWSFNRLLNCLSFKHTQISPSLKATLLESITTTLPLKATAYSLPYYSQLSPRGSRLGGFFFLQTFLKKFIDLFIH